MSVQLEDNAIVLKRAYPWVCMVDKTTKSLFYYNEENNTYSHDPPIGFFKEDEKLTPGVSKSSNGSVTTSAVNQLTETLNKLKADRAKLQSNMESRLEKDRETSIHRSKLYEQINTSVEMLANSTASSREASPTKSASQGNRRAWRGSHLEDNSSSAVFADNINSSVSKQQPPPSQFDNLALKSCSEMVEATKMNKATIRNRKPNSIFARINNPDLSIKYGSPINLYDQKMMIFKMLSMEQSEADAFDAATRLGTSNGKHSKSLTADSSFGYPALSSTSMRDESFPIVPATGSYNFFDTGFTKSRITYLDEEFENAPATSADNSGFVPVNRLSTAEAVDVNTTFGMLPGLTSQQQQLIPIVPMSLSMSASPFEESPQRAKPEPSLVNQDSYKHYLSQHSEHVDKEYELFFKRLKALSNEKDQHYVTVTDEIPPISLETVSGPFEYSDESNMNLRRTALADAAAAGVGIASDTMRNQDIAAATAAKSTKKNRLLSSGSVGTFRPSSSTNMSTLRSNGNGKLNNSSMFSSSMPNIRGAMNSTLGAAGVSGGGGLGEQLLEIYEANAVRKQVDQAIVSLLESIFTSMDLLGQSYTHSYSIYKTNTFLEEQINNTCVLDAAVKQRQRLLMPYGLREADAYCHADQLHTFCPQTMTASYFKELLQQQQAQQKRDVQLGKPKRIITKLKIADFRGWKIYTMHVQFAASAAASSSIQNMALPSSRWYVNEEMNIVQRGEPFDLKCYRLREKLREASWYGLDHLKTLHESHPEFILLRDELGGNMFYDASCDMYYCPMGTCSILTNSFKSEKNNPQYLHQQRQQQQKRTTSDNRFSSNRTVSSTAGGRMFDMINQVIKDVNNEHEEAKINKDGYIIFQHLPEPKPQRLINIEDDPTIWGKLCYGSYLQLQLIQTTFANAASASAFASASSQYVAPPRTAQRLSSEASAHSPSMRAETPGTTRLPNIAQEWGFTADSARGNTAGQTGIFQQSPSNAQHNTFQMASIDGPINVQTVAETNRQLEMEADRALYKQRYDTMFAILIFEKRMPDAKYLEYCECLNAIKQDPKNPSKYLELCLCLIRLGSDYGQHALVALFLANETMSKHSLVEHSVHVCSLLRLLMVKMAACYRNHYESPETILSIVAASPENEMVLYQAAACFQQVGCFKLAEKHLIASLLINPNYDMALRHYAHFVIERQSPGYYATAKRYLSRIKSNSAFYALVKLETILLDEYYQQSVQNCGYDTEEYNIMLSKYNELLLLYTNGSRGLNTNAENLEKIKGSVYKSLGHFFSVKNAPEKSAEFHNKLLKIQQQDVENLSPGSGVVAGNMSQNVVSMLLSACSSEGKSIAQREALFNRALLTIHPKSKYVWVSLMAYADFLLSTVNDDQRVEGLLWQAVRHSWSQVVWPTIALAHFYQYTRSEPRHGMEILLFACRSRRHYFKNNETYPENIISNAANSEKFVFSSSSKNTDIFDGGMGEAPPQDDLQSAAEQKDSGVYDYDQDFLEFQMNNHNLSSTNESSVGEEPATAAAAAMEAQNAAAAAAEESEKGDHKNASGLSQREMNVEVASILAALGYCLFDMGRLDEAHAVSQAALKYVPTFTPAFRCIGLVHHALAAYDENRKLYGTPGEGFLSGIRHGMKFASPYFLRSYAVQQLLKFESGPSLEFMHLANKLGPNSALAWRAMGFMTYLYSAKSYDGPKGSKHQRQQETIQYLDCAIQASGRMDVEAMKLKGQILLEIGNYADAKVAFQLALQVNPSDQISAACFAMASYAVNLSLNFEHQKRSQEAYDAMDNASLVAVSSQDLLLDIHNIESLFQESLSPAVIKADLAHTLRREYDEKQQEWYEQSVAQSSNDSGGSGSHFTADQGSNFPKHLGNAEKKTSDNLINVINDLNNTNGDIHYFYATYQLKLSMYYQGSKRSSHLNLAKLFYQKVAREESDIQVLGVFMLGWIEELNTNYDDAEQYYYKAIQEHGIIEPFRFMQLLALAEEMLECVSRPEDDIKKGDGSGNSKTQRQHRSKTSSQHAKKTSSGGDGAAQRDRSKMMMMCDPMAVFDYMAIPDNSGCSQYYLSTNQQPRRLMLHLKLVELLQEYRNNMSHSDGFRNLNTPSRYFSVDRQWPNKLMHAFSQCDDWSWLRTCGDMHN